jgi:acyl-ACP thioesterase
MFETIRQIGTSSTGPDGYLTVGSAVDFMQDCSIFHVDSMKDMSGYLLENKIKIFIASRQVNILKMPKYGESLTIRTWIFKINRASAYRNTVIYDKDDNACILSYTIGAFVNELSGKAVLVHDDLIKKIPMYDKYDMEYLDRKIILPKEKPVKSAPINVLKYHLDYNKHVNNSKYITIANEYAPDYFEIKQIRVEYKTPAKYKDILYPLKYTKEKSVIIDLCSENGISFATVEFAN